MIKKVDKFLQDYSNWQNLNIILEETIHHLSEVLGTTVFMYKGLEYTVPNDILDIYDIECPGCDDILYLHYLNHNLDGIVTIIHKDFLSITDDELQKLKEGQQGL